jgi:CHAD domain-containing protein
METPSRLEKESLPGETHPPPPGQNADQTKDLRDYASQKILSLVNRILNRAGKIKDENGVEALHEMRVATRRLRQTLRLFAYYYSSAQIKSALGRTKKITRLLGRPREMDVNLLLLQQLAPSEDAPWQRHLGYEYLLENLETERNRLRRKLQKRLSKLNLQSLRKEAKVLIQPRKRREKTCPGDLEGAALDSSPDSFLRALLVDRVTPWGGLSFDIFAGMDYSALHQLRIQAKNLRYTLELLNPPLGNPFDSLIVMARDLQNLLGEYHDWDILIAWLGVQLKSLQSRNRRHLREAVEAVKVEIQKKKISLRGELPRHCAHFAEVLHCTFPMPTSGGAPQPIQPDAVPTSEGSIP